MKSLLVIFLAVLSFGSSALAEPDYPASSLYNLDADLTSQSGQSHHLDVYAGEPVLITLFYGSCPMACPLLIDTLRAIERATPGEQRKDLRVLLISIDPKHDTPAALLTLARERHLDLSRWTLAHTDERTVRKIAALLNIQYRALPNGGYNHSSVITLLTPAGEIAAQSSTIGTADAALLDALRALRSR
jgi:protein SCO1